jgi:hypothetical protein
MPILLLLIVLPLIALMPLLLIQRYRAGSARRMARPWLATLHLVLMAVSAIVFLGGAALTAAWVPNAFSGAAAGVALRMALGVVGLALTRWEPTPATLHFTPNGWLVLFVTLVVSARVMYGRWRTWTVAKAGVYGTAMVTAFRNSGVVGRCRARDWLLHGVRVGSATPHWPMARAPTAPAVKPDGSRNNHGDSRLRGF